MKLHIPTFVAGIILILVGLFEFYSSSQRDVYIGIALILYGIGTIFLSTRKETMMLFGLIVNIITIILSLTALIYEWFG